MKFIKDMVNNINSESLSRKWSNEERLELLSIDANKQERIKKLLFKHVDHDDENRSPVVFKKIKLVDLVGINRAVPVDNWLDLLLHLHKKKNFDEFKGQDEFNKYVSSLNSGNGDCPHVLEVDNKYYIDGNGKHRLTIAKCLEMDEFPVFVSKLQNN
ncbi:hypothetical protein [Aeromonas hydrophila]|uniref:hypothetical protein n=1 Tax=Aeromonas hydrophila TaxID=644 RepID=UPI0011158DF6|nr:hypothetical protein [Aeromonas hydrophila]